MWTKQSGEHRALCPAYSETCQLLQGSDTSVLPVPQRCVRHVCSACSALHRPLTSIPTLSESRPLQMLQSQPKTHSSRLPSYSNASGTRERSCRENIPFQQFIYQMSLHQPAVSLHSLTREHPGRARGAQRGGILLRACPAVQRAGERSSVNLVTLDPTKTSVLCQLQEVHRHGRGLAGSCSSELSPRHVFCRHSSSVKSAVTQLHANSINPQTEPLPFWVLFMAPELLKKSSNKLV